MTSELCEDILQTLLQTYPFLRSEELTTTAYGRPVRSLVMGEGERKVMYSASHHANEWITTPLLLKFAEDLAEAVQTGGQVFGVNGRTILKVATIYIVPMVNPDGVDLVTGAVQPGTLEYEAASRIADQLPEIPFPVLCTMRDRIIQTVPGVNRVLWDISEKPVATIEFE